MSLIRILVADDFEAWRRQVCRLLQVRPELQVISEASDGLEAVQRAEELQPDLIVLGIGLPVLNGIEAAQRIRKLAPKSKILFLSQESSAEIVQEGLKSGALGYVVKAHAGTELLAAVEAVLQGRRFISSNLLGPNFIHAVNAPIMNAPGMNAPMNSPILIRALTEEQDAGATVPDSPLHEPLQEEILPSWRRTTLSPGRMLFFILAAACVILGFYIYQQRNVIRQIVSHDEESSANIVQLRSQLQDATRKINSIAAAQSSLVTRVASTARANARAAAAESNVQAARLRQLQSAISDQQMKIRATQAELARTRSELERNLTTSRSEMNNSIARTHEQLLALERRGWRDYFEFDVAKSKQFQRTGPLKVSVRQTDTKRASVDLVLLVDDREISKKGVNLYEPVWIYETRDSQPVQVVVNKIDKNGAHGYVSAPRYSRTDLSANAAPAALPYSAHPRRQ